MEHEQSTMKPTVASFFDGKTNTVSYVVHDSESRRAAIIDSVLDYDAESGTVATVSADALIAYIRTNNLTVDWILETHVHADHLTAAAYLKKILGGKTAIGRDIIAVQQIFGDVFGFDASFPRDGSQFDRLWSDEDTFMVGTIPGRILHVPGHTPADLAYVIGDAVFVGDTLFMPDYGTARCDFPGGSAEQLYASVQRIFALPDETRMFLCHDYLPTNRTAYAWETTVGAQKKENIHVNEGADAEAFVRTRTLRDALLGMPKLIIPAIQVNMRAGEFPMRADGQEFLTIPINSVFTKK